MSSILEKHGGALLVFNLCLAAMAAWFGIVVLRGGSPITPEVYGPWVYSFPALGWVSIQLASASLVCLGILFNFRIAVAIGAFIGVVMFGSFAALSSFTPHGSVLQAGSMCVTLPLSVFTLYAGLLRE